MSQKELLGSTLPQANKTICVFYKQAQEEDAACS